MSGMIIEGRCSRQDCPSDALTLGDPFVIRELRVSGVTYTCVVCGATRTEMNAPGGRTVEYGESKSDQIGES